jgi:hypothetical protein
LKRKLRLKDEAEAKVMISHSHGGFGHPPCWWFTLLLVLL